MLRNAIIASYLTSAHEDHLGVSYCLYHLNTDQPLRPARHKLRVLVSSDNPCRNHQYWEWALRQWTSSFNISTIPPLRLGDTKRNGTTFGSATSE